jgi:carbon monoxide dehydrogenase subunit G
MDLHGTYSFNEPAAALWARLMNPEVVATCLPGCDRLEPVGEDKYRTRMNMTIAAVSGCYEGTVAIVDKQPPHRYKLLIDGQGRTGFVKGQASLELNEADGKTIVTVNGTAEVGGLIARFGQRLLGTASKMMMDRFFASLQS